jgi:DNA-binding NtrC family response regulator
MLSAGEFREDLYYRLRVVEIMVPPLRDRPGDIPLLAEHFVARASRAMGGSPTVLSQEAIDALSRHSWPGNVRELENCIARGVVQAAGEVVRVEHLDLGGSAGAGPLTTLEEAERTHLTRVLEATGGQKLRAAEILGISRPRLDRLIKKYSLRARTRSRPGSPEPDDGVEGQS